MVFQGFVDGRGYWVTNLTPEDFLEGWSYASKAWGFVIRHGLDESSDLGGFEGTFKSFIISSRDL